MLRAKVATDNVGIHVVRMRIICRKVEGERGHRMVEGSSIRNGLSSDSILFRRSSLYPHLATLGICDGCVFEQTIDIRHRYLRHRYRRRLCRGYQVDRRDAPSPVHLLTLNRRVGTQRSVLSLTSYP